MPDQRSYKELQYQYEILRARLEIREHYLRTVVKEVYDNVGQVLSLIRVQLTLLRSDFETTKKEKLDSSGELVGKTIRDLRNMCQLFYPEADMITGSGFNRAVEHEIKNWYPAAHCSFDEADRVPGSINEETGLVLFEMLLEIITLIKEESRGQLNSIDIKYKPDKMHIGIEYSGETLRRNIAGKRVNPFDLSLSERAELLGGELGIKNSGRERRRIKLVIPIN